MKYTLTPIVSTGGAAAVVVVDAATVVVVAVASVVVGAAVVVAPAVVVVVGSSPLPAGRVVIGSPSPIGSAHAAAARPRIRARMARRFMVDSLRTVGERRSLPGQCPTPPL